MEENIYYHIHKINTKVDNSLWHVGAVIEIGNEINDFYRQSLEFKPVIDDFLGHKNFPWINASEYVLRFDPTNFIEHKKLLNFGKYITAEYAMLLREIAYEEVRSKYFNNLPSRTKCIYLCKENQLEFWKTQFSSKYKVFKVKVFGDVFKSSNDFIPLPTDSYKEILEKAKKYWSYSSSKEKITDEYLYVGKIEILEEI